MALFSKIFTKMLSPKTSSDANFEEQVKIDGVEHASSRIADLIDEKLQSHDLALQFVLEELDAARDGNQRALNFVNNSGFSPYEYIGSMEKTAWEGDESQLEHVQLYFRHFTTKISDIDLMVELSINVIDKIMRKYAIGKYNNLNVESDDVENACLMSVVEKLDRSDDGVFARIQNDLAIYVAKVGTKEDALRLMAYAYARRCAGAGLLLQNIWDRDEYTYTFEKFKEFQSFTQQRQNIEPGSQQSIVFQNEAAKQAAELLNSYNPRLKFEIISCMLSMVETGDVPNFGMVAPDSIVLDLMEKTLQSINNNATTATYDDDIPF